MVPTVTSTVAVASPSLYRYPTRAAGSPSPVVTSKKFWARTSPTTAPVPSEASYSLDVVMLAVSAQELRDSMAPRATAATFARVCTRFPFAGGDVGPGYRPTPYDLHRVSLRCPRAFAL